MSRIIKTNQALIGSQESEIRGQGSGIRDQRSGDRGQGSGIGGRQAAKRYPVWGGKRRWIDLYGLVEVVLGVGVVESAAHKDGRVLVCFVFSLIFLEESNLFSRLLVFIQKLLYGLKHHLKLFIIF